MKKTLISTAIAISAIAAATACGTQSNSTAPTPPQPAASSAPAGATPADVSTALYDACMYAEQANGAVNDVSPAESATDLGEAAVIAKGTPYAAEFAAAAKLGTASSLAPLDQPCLAAGVDITK